MPIATPIATILASNIERSRRKLIVAAAQSNALMAWAMANNRVEYEDGGYNITNPLLVGRNPNVGTHKYYEPVPVAQTSEFAKAEYRWSRFVGSVIISEQEEDENKGESAVFKLVKGKMEALELSIKEKFNEYLYGAGAGDDPYGLAALIPDDPTTGTLGGISRVSNTWWRTNSYDANGTLDATNIEEAFDDILMDLSLNNDRPDLILAGRNIIRLYRAAIRDKLVITLPAAGQSGKAMYDLGFKGFTHEGITVLYDEKCPPNKAYFINSRYLRMHVLRHVNMRTKNLVAPWNIDASGKRVQWQGQFALWAAYRRHAVLINE